MLFTSLHCIPGKNPSSLQTVVLEQSQQWHHEDVCDPELLIKYVGIGVTCFLLCIFILVTAAGRGVWDMFLSMRINTASTWMAAILFHVIADSQWVRDNREINLYAGLAMKYWEVKFNTLSDVQESIIRFRWCAL